MSQRHASIPKPLSGGIFKLPWAPLVDLRQIKAGAGQAHAGRAIFAVAAAS